VAASSSSSSWLDEKTDPLRALSSESYYMHQSKEGEKGARKQERVPQLEHDKLSLIEVLLHLCS